MEIEFSAFTVFTAGRVTLHVNPVHCLRDGYRVHFAFKT